MKKLNKRLIAAILAIIIAISGVSGYLAYNSYAAKSLDESKTVTFAAFSARKEIPETTIFIGTHLITLESATDELWQQAVDSQATSGQEEIYYKSELTNGIWYDITDAESIMDINGNGNANAVTENHLAELLVMYYTFDYGITRLAINDMRHCIFDGDYDYWDLYHLDELESIKNEYDIIVSRNNDKSRMDKFYRDLLSNFFNRDLRNSVTDKADDALYALQDVYDALIEADRKDDADIIYKLMAKLDNARRAEIFRQLADEAEVSDAPSADDENLTPLQKALRDIFGIVEGDNAGDLAPSPSRTYNNILDELLQKANGTGFEDDDDFITNNDVVSAISNDTGECQTTYLEKSNDRLEPNGTRVIDTLIFDLCNKIIDAAPNGLDAIMDADIMRLGYLFNIDDEKVINKEEELNIVDNELLGPVTDKFSSAALARPSAEYNVALNANASDSALSGLLDIQESDVDSIRLELQDVIKAKTDRMAAEDAMAFTYDRINMSQDMNNKVPTTDFAGNAKTQIKRHIKWLSDLLAELYEKTKSGNSELDELKKKAESLLNQQQSLLDSNDYRKAAEIEKARQVVLDKIDEMMAKLSGIINDPNANAGDKALAQAILDGGNDGMDKLLQEIVNDALEKIENGEDIGDEVDLLSSLGFTEGLEQLGITDGTGDGLGGIGGGTGGGTGDGTTDGTGGLSGKGISEDALLGLLASLLGDINNLSAEQLASAIRAMEMIYDMGYANAGSLSARLANIAMTKGNKYIYNQINDSGATEYVNIYTLAKVAGYRWTYNNTKKTNALIGYGAKPTYQFAAGDDALYEVVNKDTRNPILKELSKMSAKVRLYSNLYAPVDVASDYFECVACHIKKSTYGVCITNKMEGEAKSLVDQLLPMIEGTN